MDVVSVVIISFLILSLEVDGCITKGFDVGVIIEPSGLKFTGVRKTAALLGARPTPGGTEGTSDSDTGTRGNFIARNSGDVPSSEPGQIISLITSQYEPFDLLRPGNLDAKEHFRYLCILLLYSYFNRIFIYLLLNVQDKSYYC